MPKGRNKYAMHTMQSPLFDFEALIAAKSNDRLVMVLEALPAEKLILTLERDRRTGRKGHAIRDMWPALIAGLLYECHSLAQVARLLSRNKDVRMVRGLAKIRYQARMLGAASEKTGYS